LFGFLFECNPPFGKPQEAGTRRITEIRRVPWVISPIAKERPLIFALALIRLPNRMQMSVVMLKAWRYPSV
jgi:hypothetical protein